MKSHEWIICGLRFYLGLFVFTTALHANPTGGTVAAGSASIAGQGTGTVTVNQASNVAIINWQSFSINSGESTQFIQPSAQSAALNRVLGGQTSVINGTLSANGQIYLVNGNGIVVGPSGVISANAFTASTRDISDADFLAGNLHFTGNGDAGVQNFGKIEALGGDVVLIGKTVDNQGTINASHGTAGLVAADDVLLAQKNADGSTITVSPSTMATSASGKTGVHNSGTITASAAELKAANGNIYALAVQNEGTIRASTVLKQGGHIWLTSDSGTVSNSGTLDVSATAVGGAGGTVVVKSATGTAIHTGKIIAQGGQGGTGGNVDISGAAMQFSGSVDTTAVNGTTGNLLLDPATLTVITGGSTSSLTASTVDPSFIDTTLNTTNVTLNADNSIAITNGINWTSNKTLTLSTNNSSSTITINAPISGPNGGLTIDAASYSDQITTGANGAVQVAKFILQNGYWNQNSTTLPGFSTTTDFEIEGSGLTSSTFVRVAGGDGSAGNPYKIVDIYGLQGIGSSYATLGVFPASTPYYEQTQGIDATQTSTWNNGAGFKPIGTGTGEAWFTGNYDGQGYTINNLTIDLPTSQYVGLFGAATGTITNTHLTNVSVTGNFETGGLVGELAGGTISNSSVSGTVTGAGTSPEYIGGLMGGNYGYPSTITTSYSTATVSAPSANEVGGLAGIFEGTLSDSYATGAVTGDQVVGGLLGENGAYDSSTVTDCYATGSVTGVLRVGGFVGLDSAYHIGQSASISDSYSTGNVTASSQEAGGFVGDNGQTSSLTGTILDCYSTGSVSGTTTLSGGFVGMNNSGSITDSFWDTSNTSLAGVGYSDGGTTSNLTGQTTSALKLQATFTTGVTTNSGTAWDFTNTWAINSSINGGTPYFKGQLTTLVITVGNQTATYDGSVPTLSSSTDYTITGGSVSDLTAAPVLTVAGTSVNAGSSDSIVATATPIAGYTVLVINGNLSITQATLNVSANAGETKTYGQSASSIVLPSPAFAVTGLGTGDSFTGESRSSTGDDTTANVGTYSVTVSGGVGTLNATSANQAGGTFANDYTIVYGTTANALTVNKATLTISATAGETKTYGQGVGSEVMPSSTFTMTGLVSGDSFNGETRSSTGDDATANAGSYDVTTSGGSGTLNSTSSGLPGGTFANDYNVVYSPTTNGLTVNAKIVTVTLSGNATKTYDGTSTVLDSSGLSLSVSSDQLVGSDSVTVSHSSYGYDDVNAGNPVGIYADGLSLNNSNYSLGGVTVVNNTSIGVINAKTVTVTLSGNATKTYDGTSTVLDSSGLSLSISADQLVGSDSVTVSHSSYGYDDVNASNSVGIYADGLSLNNSNYTLNGVTVVNNTSIGVINPKTVTVTLAGNATKTYDGTSTVLDSSGLSLSVSSDQLVGSDSVTVSHSSYGYDDANAGNPVGIYADGLSLNNSNYTLGGVTVVNNTGIGVINAKTVTVTLSGNATKTYDGTSTVLDSSGLSLSISSDQLVGSDSVTVNHSSYGYDDANAGNSVGIYADGLWLSNSNYTLGSVTVVNNTGIGVINPKTVTVTLAGNATKTYDGTSTVLDSSGLSLSVSSDQLVGSDSVTVNHSSYGYDDANAGNPVGIYADGLWLSNSNYTLGSVTVVNNTSIGVINPKTVTVTLSGNATKTYDGTSTVLDSSGLSLSISSDQLIGSDSVTVNHSSYGYDDANAGNPVGIYADGLWLSNSNYTLGSVTVVNNSNIGVINQKLVTATLTGNTTKTYDGTNTVTNDSGLVLSVSSDQIVGDDTVTVNHTGYLYDGVNVNDPVGVTASGLSLSNANYTLGSVVSIDNTGIGAITPATLVYVANPASRPAGQPNPSFTGTVNGFVNGETITTPGVVNGTLTFGTTATASSPAGLYAINGSGLTAENYVFVQAPANATALTIGGYQFGRPGQPFFNFSAQFNANADYNRFFTQSQFWTFDPKLAGWLIPVFSPGNAPHPVYTAFMPGFGPGGKPPGGVIAFGSSFTVKDQGGN